MVTREVGIFMVGGLGEMSHDKNVFSNSRIKYDRYFPEPLAPTPPPWESSRTSKNISTEYVSKLSSSVI